MSTKIKNWNGEEYTLDQLDAVVDDCDTHECSFDDMMGGDLSSTPAIVHNLIERVRELEKAQDA